MRMLLASVVLVAAVSAALAQPRRAGPPSSFVELAYPKDALDKRVIGTVILAVKTDATGRVIEAEPLAGPALLATPAAANAKLWTLTPGGRSEALAYYFEIEPALCEDDRRSLFRLRRYNVAIVTACSTHGRRGVSESNGDMDLFPMSLGKAPAYPQIALSARIDGAVLLDLAIDAKGDVVEARALNDLPMLDRVAVDHAKTWRFYPSSYPRRRGAFVYEFAFDSQLCAPHEERQPFWRVGPQYHRLSACPPVVQAQR
jgi:TonB family protein